MKGNAAPLSKGDTLLQIKSVILSLGSIQEQIVRSAFHVICTNSEVKPESIDAFKESLAFYALASNTKEPRYVIPQEFLNDLFDFINSFLPNVTPEFIKSELGKISTRKRKRALSPQKTENYFSFYNGKNLHFVSHSLSILDSFSTPPRFLSKKKSRKAEKKLLPR